MCVDVLKQVGGGKKRAVVVKDTLKRAGGGK